jgi:hypothetical protein
MSHRSVERTIGRLVTDDGFRRRFIENPALVIDEVVASGLDLNPCERRALVAIDPRLASQFAEALDPSLQRIEAERPYY